MRKFSLMIFSLLLISSVAYSGGIVTNYNQSAAYIRMFARDATTDIDAVFFNPAGLTKLQDGWHFSFSYQNLDQTRKVTSTFPYLNDGDFEGEAKIPIFPSFYTAYKTGKFVFSFGFNPVGGGGTATFHNGLPTMENPISTLVPKLTSLGVTGYSMNSLFKGKSVIFGFQAGVSYEINENISVFGGLRYLKAENSYEGYIKDIMVTSAAGESTPSAFLNGVAAPLSGAALSMQGLVDGYGANTFAELNAVITDPATLGALEALANGLLALGIPQAAIDAMSMAVAQGTFNGAAAELNGQAAYLAIVMADQEADVVQTGSGVTKIIGANLSFMDGDLNIGLKYEFLTKIDLINETAVGKGFTTGLTSGGDRIEMFPDGAITNADMPALLSVGLEYKLTKPFTVAIGYHTYFDSKAGWAFDEEGNSKIDGNSTEFALGLQYEITDKFLVSCGYLNTKTGANALYQSDIKHVLSSNSGSFGGAYKLNEKVTFNFGVSYTKYKDLSVSKSYPLSETINVPSIETYSKDNLAIAFGINYSILK